jgi:hypothetical protein
VSERAGTARDARGSLYRRVSVMPVRRDRKYQEAVALWRSVSDAPVPQGDAGVILQAALERSSIAGYERFQTRWLRDPNLTWAVYRDAQSRWA